MNYRIAKNRYQVLNGLLSDESSSREFWSPLLNVVGWTESSTDSSSEPASKSYVVWNGRNSWDSVDEDVRAVRFAAVQEAIKHMADLPADSDFHVDEEAAVRASNLLAVMSHNFAIIPPRVMPQDADSVVFTWDHGNLKRYLTVDSSDFGVMDLNKSQRVRCVHDLGGTADAYTKLIEIIGAEPLSSTNTGGNA